MPDASAPTRAQRVFGVLLAVFGAALAVGALVLGPSGMPSTVRVRRFGTYAMEHPGAAWVGGVSIGLALACYGAILLAHGPSRKSGRLVGAMYALFAVGSLLWAAAVAGGVNSWVMPGAAALVGTYLAVQAAKALRGIDVDD